MLYSARYMGLIVVIVTAFFAGVTVLVYSNTCVWENCKRDELGTAEGCSSAYQDDLTN